MSHSAYPYSQGDRLNDRNTYFYSEFSGSAFLEAWHSSRGAALVGLPAPLQPVCPARGVPDDAAYDTAQLLAYLLNTPADANKQARLADSLLQRFEVSKRLYRKYNGAFRAVQDSGYDELELYLLFAALCVRCQSRPAAMRFLSALLKALDSLISVQQRLRPDQGAQLAWLIYAERAWVERIAARVGVEVPA